MPLISRKLCLVIIGAGEGQLPLILAGKSKGYIIIAIDRNHQSVGFQYVDIKIYESTTDTEVVLNRLSEYETEYKICGVICRSTGRPLYTANCITSKYNIPRLCEKILPLVTEKSKLRQFCEKNNIIMPKGRRLGSINEVLNLPFPLIVKPDFTRIGKKAIKVVNTQHTLNLALSDAIESSGNSKAEVEEYISGFDVSCLVHSNHGIGQHIISWDELVSVKEVGDIIGLGISAPSVIEGKMIEKDLQKIINSFCSHFPDINGILIFSFRVSKQEIPYLIEIHADLGGDLIAELLIPATYKSFNYFDFCIDIAVGKKLEATLHNHAKAAVLYDNSYLNKNNEFLEMASDNTYLLTNDNIMTLHRNFSLSYNNKLFYNKSITHHLDYLEQLI